MSGPLTSRLAHALETGFDGARVVVVGGSGGVGRATCAQAAALGAHVVSASRSGAPLREARAPGRGEVTSAALDITRPESIAAFAAWADGALGQIEVLVATAGVTRSAPLAALELLDDALIDVVTASNHTGVLRTIRDLKPLLDRGGAPVVVTVSSVAARTGVGSNVAYVGAKAAMDAVSVALAKALAPTIRFVSVAPSALDTEFAKGRGPEFIERTIKATPLGRLATVEEVADAVLIAARLLPMTTGATIYVDGGRHL